MATTNAPNPQAMIIKPIWLIVEYAKIFLISDWVRETMPANTAVAAPITAINVIATGDRTINGLNRTNKNGPAFTMVAA